MSLVAWDMVPKKESQEEGDPVVWRVHWEGSLSQVVCLVGGVPDSCEGEGLGQEDRCGGGEDGQEQLEQKTEQSLQTE